MRKMDDLMQQIKNKVLEFKPKYSDEWVKNDKSNEYVALFDALNKYFGEVDWYFQSKKIFYIYIFINLCFRYKRY